jgi:hypothetical protein
MKNALPQIVVSLAVAVALTALLYRRVNPDPPEPPEPVPATCRQVWESPAAYAGRPVRLRTDGSAEAGDRLVWRPDSEAAPAVVMEFDGSKVPDPVPDEVVGVCHAPVAGGPVRVRWCRPAP